MFQDNSSIASGAITQYLWDFNNDGIADETGLVASFNLGDSGTYEATLECISENGCKSSTTKKNQVFDKPAAGFTASNTSLGENTAFTNTTTVADGIISISLWDFGDSVTSTLPDPLHKYSAAGTYKVRLISVSDKNCRDTIDNEVTIVPSIKNSDGQLSVSSGLVTPNGDGWNDFLKIDNLSAYTGCKVSVYNRWNDLVYSNTKYNNDWSGESLDAGAYFYIINCDDKEIMGTINILK